MATFMSMKVAQDQFSYPERFAEGTALLQKYSAEILRDSACETVHVTLFENRCWMKVMTGAKFPETSLENVLYRSVVQEGYFIEIPDVLNHPSYKFIAFRGGFPLIRYIAAIPIFAPCKIVTGAITLIDGKRNQMSERMIQSLESYASLIGKSNESSQLRA
jgi:hypothetical protein